MSQAFKFDFGGDEDIEVDDPNEGEVPESDNGSTVGGVPTLGMTPNVLELDDIVRLSHLYTLVDCHQILIRQRCLLQTFLSFKQPLSVELRATASTRIIESDMTATVVIRPAIKHTVQHPSASNS